MGLTSVRLPDELTTVLDRLAAERETTRSELIREAVEQFCTDATGTAASDRVALLDRLVSYRGSERGDLAAKGESYLRDFFHARRRRRSG